MLMSVDQCYQAVITRDGRFDGRFFVAVKTTRVYCRPICRVKPPLQKNCLFFATAAEAEVAGFRPCKRCRPELAPGYSQMETSSRLARSAAYHIGLDFLFDHSLAEMSEKLGVTDRQLRRVFRIEFGVSPVDFWQTQRLLLAKQLLTDTTMSISEVAIASGFRSFRRFNTVLQERYRCTPTEFRKGRAAAAKGGLSEVAVRVAYRPPFDWDHLLQFLSLRAIPQVEEVRDGLYRRTVRIEKGGQEYGGVIEVRDDPARQLLSVSIPVGLLPVCTVIVERVKMLFDVSADCQAIDRVLGPLSSSRPGLRVPGCFDGFEMAVRAVLGQQVSVAAARTLAGRLASDFGTRIARPEYGLSVIFPSAAALAEATVQGLRQIGVTERRAETLLALAMEVSVGELILEPGTPIETAIERLKRIPGVGEWTAQYIAMRALSWPDAFPHTDLCIRKALGDQTPAKILEATEKWRPWRSYAALHLWASLSAMPQSSVAIRRVEGNKA